jgi:hypothetical protein
MHFPDLCWFLNCSVQRPVWMREVGRVTLRTLLAEHRIQKTHVHKITNVPFYIALGLDFDFDAGKSITRAIGRSGPWIYRLYINSYLNLIPYHTAASYVQSRLPSHLGCRYICELILLRPFICFKCTNLFSRSDKL